jgi:TP901 family phage tail tape measure protein
MASKYAIETVFRMIDNITAPLDKIGIKGNKVGNKLKNDFSGAQKKVAEFGKEITKAVATAAAGIGAGSVITFSVKGIKDAGELSTAMAKVGTVANTTPEALDGMQKALLKVSNATGIAATELAGAQYEAIRAGIDAASSVDFVSVATKAAKGGFTDTATAINGITTVLNAYGLKADQATKISDQMMIAQHLGKTTFGEIAESIGSVIPIASSLNIGTDELLSSVATLSSSGIGAGKAMMGIKGILSSIIKPSAEASKMAKSLGIDFSEASLKSKGLKGFLDMATKATGGDQKKLTELFGSKALNSLTVLTGKGSSLFDKSMKAMASSAGATNEAFEKMDATPAERMDRLLNKVKNAGINLGGALSPVVEKMVDKISEFADELNKVDFKPIADKAGKVAEKIADFAKLLWNLRVPILAVIATVLLYKGAIFAAALVQSAINNAIKIGKAVTLAYNVVTNGTAAIIRSVSSGQALWTLRLYASIAAEKIGAAATAVFSGAVRLLNFLFVSSPIGWIILGIAALVAIVIICAKNWDKITAAVSTAWKWITKTATAIWNMATGALSSLIGKIDQNSNKILGFIAIFTGPFAFVISAIKELVTNWDFVTNAFKSDGILGGIKAIGSAILSGIMAPIQGILETIGKIPGIGKWAADAASKMQGVRDQLTGKTPQTIAVVQKVIPATTGAIAPTGKTPQAIAVVQKVIPASTGAIAPIAATTRTIASVSSQPRGFNIPGDNNRQISSSVASPVAPVTNRDVMESYQEKVSRSRVDVVVGAEKGATAKVSKGAPPPDVKLTRSGGKK